MDTLLLNFFFFSGGKTGAAREGERLAEADSQLASGWDWKLKPSVSKGCACSRFLVSPASVWFPFKFPHEKVISNAAGEKYSRNQALEKQHSFADHFFLAPSLRDQPSFTGWQRAIMSREREAWAQLGSSCRQRVLGRPHYDNRVPLAPSRAECGAEADTQGFPLLMILSCYLLSSNESPADIPSSPSDFEFWGSVQFLLGMKVMCVLRPLPSNFLCSVVRQGAVKKAKMIFTVVAWTRHQKSVDDE